MSDKNTFTFDMWKDDILQPVVESLKSKLRAEGKVWCEGCYEVGVTVDMCDYCKNEKLRNEA